MSGATLKGKSEKIERGKDQPLTRTLALELIKESFEPFETDSSGTCDISDVGNIVRSLSLNPTQSELYNLISDITMGEDTVHKIPLERLQERMVPVLLEKKWQRDGAVTIKRAFEAIDLEKKGYIEPEKLAGLLATLGEPFTPEEIEDMFSVAVDTDKGVIVYEEYSSVLARD